MTEPGVPVEQHRDRILALVERLPPTRTGLAEAGGRACAEQVRARVPVPRFDHAAMDGYAVRVADVAGATELAPIRLPVTAVLAAGADTVPALEGGTAVRIMTGAPLPDGADAVVPFEWTDSGHREVRVRRSPDAGRHIRRAGEDVAVDTLLAQSGDLLTPRRLGLLAAAGHAEVLVHPAPRVAIVTTGAELVGAATPAVDGLGRVTDSNAVTLAAAARAAGAEVATAGPVRDDPEALRVVLADAVATADLVVTTGGISAGDHDVVKAAFGGRPDFWFGPVAVRPGRPQGVGALATEIGRRVPVIAVPGSPVAAYLSFRLFVVPALRRLAGRRSRRATAELASDVPARADRTAVLPGTYDDEGRVAVIPGHAGHSLAMLAAADALLLVPPGGRLLAAGTRVEVLPLDAEDR